MRVARRKKLLAKWWGSMVCVCVKYDDFSDTTMPGHNSTNLEAEIFFWTEISLIYLEHSADYFIIS